jgi:hypothetical protein
MAKDVLVDLVNEIQIRTANRKVFEFLSLFSYFDALRERAKLSLLEKYLPKVA